MKQVRILLWVLVALAAAGSAMLYLNADRRPEPRAAEPAAAIGGPFTLLDGDGKPFSSIRLTGKPYAIFFGFTNCPDVCPVALGRLTRLRRQLAQGDEALPILFVTVDPERDGPREVGRYAASFGGPIIGLTGSPARIEQVKKQFAVFSGKAGPGGSGMINHSASILLFDRDGRYRARISPDDSDQAALAKLRDVTA